MKRSFLTALGLEKDVIDQIMSEHGNTVELTKEKVKDDADKLSEKLNKKIELLQEKIDNIPEQQSDEEDWKSKHDTLSKDFKAYKEKTDGEIEGYKGIIEFNENKEKENKKLSILSDKLVAEGANPTRIKKILKEFELDKIDFDGDNIKDVEKLIEYARKETPEWFGTFETQGTNPATPPNSNPRGLTRADVEKMTPKEINENWTAIQEVLKE